MSISRIGFALAATFILAGTSANAAGISMGGASGGISLGPNGANISGGVQGLRSSASGGLSAGQNGGNVGGRFQTSGNNGSFIAGGQIGYNYQFGPVFVVGIEADIHGVPTRGLNMNFGNTGMIPTQ